VAVDRRVANPLHGGADQVVEEHPVARCEQAVPLGVNGLPVAFGVARKPPVAPLGDRAQRPCGAVLGLRGTRAVAPVFDHEGDRLVLWSEKWSRKKSGRGELQIEGRPG
jgi:hypothetical protein